MSDTYTVIGEALFDFMEAMDISAALPEPENEDAPIPSWGTVLNRLPKADELSAYPAFAITPDRDGQETGDTDTDVDAITYSIFIIVSNREGNVSEARLRKLVDVIRPKFRTFRRDPSPLHPSASNVAFSGQWGGNSEQGERWYQLNVTVYVYETLETEEP